MQKYSKSHFLKKLRLALPWPPVLLLRETKALRVNLQNMKKFSPDWISAPFVCWGSISRIFKNIIFSTYHVEPWIQTFLIKYSFSEALLQHGSSWNTLVCLLNSIWKINRWFSPTSTSAMQKYSTSHFLRKLILALPRLRINLKRG